MRPDAFDPLCVSTLPCAGGLIAGTLALMTCWAAPESHQPASEEQQRRQMARKIVSNLHVLRQHPDVAPALRLVIGKVQARWMALAQAPSEPAAIRNAVH
jgi:hypothetical protein